LKNTVKSSSSNDYFKQLDAFRFFAAMSVLLSHWLNRNELILKLDLGYVGVDFFFVISGFLISLQLLRQKEKIDQLRLSKRNAYLIFFIKRAFRIFPLYFLVLIIATFLNKGEIREAAIYNFTYTSNFYFIGVQKWNAIFSHFWSLSVEEHFYLFWPLILFFLPKKRTGWMIVLIAIAALVFRWIVFSKSPDYLSVHIHTFSCLDQFMFGAGLACLYFFHNLRFRNFFTKKENQFIISTALIGVYLIFVLSKHPYYNWVFFRFLFGFSVSFFLGCIAMGFKGIIGNFLENKYLIWGGKLSYGIYLLHNFVPGMLLGLNQFELPFEVVFLIQLCVTILLSYFLYRFFELPMRNYGKKLVLKLDG